jgi:hypothetical protein
VLLNSELKVVIQLKCNLRSVADDVIILHNYQKCIHQQQSVLRKFLEPISAVQKPVLDANCVTQVRCGQSWSDVD